MKHFLFNAALTGLVLICAHSADAADWDKYQPPEEEHTIDRGPGFYLSILKFAFVIPVFLIWIKMADWISRDADMICESTPIKGEIWNPITVGTFLIGLLCVLFIPIFLVGYPIYFLCAIVPFFVYVSVRNGAVLEEEDKVFTKRHLILKWKSRHLEEGEEYEEPTTTLAQDLGPQVEFKALGPDNETRQRNLIAARQIPAYLNLKEMLTDAEAKRCESIKLEYNQDAVSIKYQIDGFWYPMPPLDRVTGDQLLAVLKTLGNLNPADRRGRQQAHIEYKLHKNDKRCFIRTQGTATGETAVLDLSDKKARSWSLDDLGMQPDMQEKLKTLMNQSGYAIVAAMPAGGLTTTWSAVLHSIDRVTREFVGFIEPNNVERQIENIAFHDVTAETFAAKYREIMLKEPDAFACPNPLSAEAINLLCHAVNNPKDPKFAISHIRAKSATEVLLRMLNYKCDRKEFAKAVRLVLFQRLARRLCDACKQPLAPNPQLWQKLGIPAGTTPTMFGPYKPPPPESLVDEKGNPIEPPVCQACAGLGSRGRIAIFELLEVNDLIRQTLVTQPKLEALNAAARKSGHRTIQDQGIRLLAEGVISLSELQRVVKQ